MDRDQSVAAADPFRVLCVYRAYPGRERQLEDALVAACTTIRNDEGLVGLTLARSVEISGGFQMLMRWKGRQNLTGSYVTRQGKGLMKTLTGHCDSVAFDVLVPCDPTGAQGPAPDRIGKFMVTRVAILKPQHVTAARHVMEARTRLVQSASGCLWVMGNTHADRGDFLFYASGWESRLAWETACQELDLPKAWADVVGLSTAVSLDLLEPILDLAPDAPRATPPEVARGV